MLKVFAVFDIKAEAYGKPIFQATEGLARRGFEEACMQDGPLSQYPGDYKLFELGTYDPNTGKFESLPQPKYLLSAESVVIRKKAVKAADAHKAHLPVVAR